MTSTTSTPAAPAAATRPPSLWTPRLWGLADPRVDLALSAITVAFLIWTRFAFLASGPWEWDETLFARGILHFDIRAHFPHPPGFPLWLALGWLIRPLVSEPLVGLQILSAAFSVLTLWPLAALARRASPPVVATTTALVFLLMPGVWMHAPRGFSETPSAFFALWAAALAVDGLAGRRATAFSALLTAAFLIRPILLPPLAVLWLAGALSVRPRRRLLPGVAIGAGAAIAATGAMIALQGSWASFADAFVDHATRHARGLAENAAGFAQLGIVKGCGGVWVAITVLVLSVLGLIVWARRHGARLARAWAAVVIVGIAQLVWLQDRAYPRYAIPFQLAAAPLVAAAAAAVAPPAAAACGLASLGAFLALRAYPVVAEQHSTEMSAWAALRFAVETANRDGYELVVEPGLAPFTSYLQELDSGRDRTWQAKVHLSPSPLAVKTLPEGRYLVVTDKPQRYLPPLRGRSWVFSGESRELEALSQGRFERTVVIENPPLPISGWQNVARDERAIQFVWGGTDAHLLLPPLPAGVTLAMDVEPTDGPSALELQVNGVSAAVLPGSIGRRKVWLDPGALVAGRSNQLAFSRPEAYTPRPGARPQALRLSGLRALGGPFGWSASLASAPEREWVHIAVVAATGEPTTAATLDGARPRETLPGGTGAWTAPSAHLKAPVAPGIVRLLLWAPRPTPPQLEVWLNGALFAGPLVLGTAPAALDLHLGPEVVGGAMDLELRSVPYTSNRAVEAAPLGVFLGAVELRPPPGTAAPTLAGAPATAGAGWQFVSLAPGLYLEEHFGDARAAWTRPAIRMRLPAGSGRLDLTAWAPRALAPHFEVWLQGRRLAGPIDLPNKPVKLEVDVPASAAPSTSAFEVELRSVPFVPGGRDARQLGIVISAVAYVPAAAAR